MKHIDGFMHVFMYELETYLLQHKEELKSVSFQSDEANTDRPLKEFLKVAIQFGFNSIPSNSKLSAVQINGEKVTLEELLKFRIVQVLLPEELTDNIRDQIKKNKGNAVFTNPDLCFLITDGERTYIRTVELKSTKKDAIPGSSVQQIQPDEWVIFVKHNGSKIDIVTGKYIDSINSEMNFPDRSPRPKVSFKELKSKSNERREIYENSTISFSLTEDKDKYFLINDWQGVLKDNWLKIIFNHKRKTNEPWFNNVLRKYTLSILLKYDYMSEEERKEFKENLKRLLDKSEL